jgi:hypothetical protein
MEFGIQQIDLDNAITVTDESRQFPDIMFPEFKINSFFYSIEINNKNNPMLIEISPILEWDEILGQPGVYCWLIGIDRNGVIQLWAKKADSVQEVQTKHFNIIQELGDNITTILFAGELRHNGRNMVTELRQAATLEFNLLSGTFMSPVGISTPERLQYITEQHEHIVSVIQNIISKNTGIPRENIIYNQEVELFNNRQRPKSYITQPMTLELLQTYKNSGASIYKYPTQEVADYYRNNSRTINGRIFALKQTIATQTGRKNMEGLVKNAEEELKQKEQILADRINYLIPPEKNISARGRKKTVSKKNKRTKQNKNKHNNKKTKKRRH